MLSLLSHVTEPPTYTYTAPKNKQFINKEHYLHFWNSHLTETFKSKWANLFVTSVCFKLDTASGKLMSHRYSSELWCIAQCECFLSAMQVAEEKNKQSHADHLSLRLHLGSFESLKATSWSFDTFLNNHRKHATPFQLQMHIVLWEQTRRQCLTFDSWKWIWAENLSILQLGSNECGVGREFIFLNALSSNGTVAVFWLISHK